MRISVSLLALLLGSLGCGDDDASDAGADAASRDVRVVDSATDSVGRDAIADSAIDTASDPGTTPDGGPGCDDLSDDFEDPTSLSCWSSENLEFAEAGIASGRLSIRFTDGSPSQNGWFADNQGPALTRQVSGNFLAVLEVDAHRAGGADEPPTQEFNSAGLLARDPASRTPNQQNWIMWNTGSQGSSNCESGSTRVAVGSEGKTTVNSSSTLCLDEGSHRGRLALCRVGAEFRLLRKLEGDETWTETHSYTRADLPELLDVGILANGWQSPPDLHAEFESFQLTVPESLDACSAENLEAAQP